MGSSGWETSLWWLLGDGPRVLLIRLRVAGQAWVWRRGGTCAVCRRCTCSSRGANPQQCSSPRASPWPDPGGQAGWYGVMKGCRGFSCSVASCLASVSRFLIISRLCFHRVRRTCLFFCVLFSLQVGVNEAPAACHFCWQAGFAQALPALLCFPAPPHVLPARALVDASNSTRSNVALRDLVTFSSCSLRRVFWCLPDACLTADKFCFLLFVICLW